MDRIKKKVAEEKYVSMHEIEISVAVIPVQERKEGSMSKSRKHKKALEKLQPEEKYHKIYYTKKVNSDDEGEKILPGKESEHEKKKRIIFKLIPDLLSCPIHHHGILTPKKVVEKDKSKKNHSSPCMMTFMHT